MKKVLLLLWLSIVSLSMFSAEQFISFTPLADYFPLIVNGQPCIIKCDSNIDKGVKIAIDNLQQDIFNVCGTKPEILTEGNNKRCVLIGTYQSPIIQQLIKSKKLNKNELNEKTEKFLLQIITNPCEGVDEALVIAGSDKRGTIYGIYELSRQMGVSPWYWWADVPVAKQKNVYIKPGIYTDGEPAVRYRGIFLNDEAPCLTSWVKHTYGTKYGDHRFYARVFELILRLRGNFMWPAMWSWSFYADDPENSKTANEMGIIMGTSHHEPMARNHQEWARKRKEYGVWDYTSNQKTIDQFFREGIERAADTEDLITIGMRGDGDAPMGGKEGKDHEYAARDKDNIRLLEKIFKNQRRIIKEVTGEAPEKRPQVWAIYKEVQRYYDMGLRAPDDVIMLLTDDNWGNVTRLPNAEERKHPGGWGMYYHVDYVGAPRNSKWLNVTPIQNMWEQLQLTYDYGVDKLWILNVGDLKPMEYPITLFLDMAWNPKQYTADNLQEHPRQFCAQQFGKEQADEAMHILNLYSKYAGRVTPEMLDCKTYNLKTGEWKQVSDEFVKLEAEALRQYTTLKPEYKDAYKQLILFPVQAMANLYEMYYAQAMNHKLYKENNPQANEWADRVEKAFARDKALSNDYNNVMSGGKWKNMMIQKHIGYTSWNDNFPADRLPEVFRIQQLEKATGGYIFTGENGYVAMEAEHYFSIQNAADAHWTVIPHIGRTLSGMALMPYTQPTDGASISYKMKLPKETKTVNVHIVVKSTLAFHDSKGHKYNIGFEGGKTETVNFNHNLNEDPKNVYSVFYPTVARRIVEKKVKLELPRTSDVLQTLIFRPLDPGIVLEKIVIDYGGYKKSYLFMDESPNKRMAQPL
ncbi:glycosyl hydrolase 115 family protein [Bacteroides zhangwenhongii]|uniref:Glycosyl hydrolase 115 family protein n=1 Tax=Bacteroides zhangwenhongii TaxID=2650157 RepID=A0ABT5HE24_9BACE|nr:glycosyl hydrolase 115 family protein [Bacteroides zhangwenhongii]MDC7138729.1 glycosyl hydrolase 115 family protein [Bacteroides zhangwenhongii]OKZ23813.1 MAG: glycosyhydrolase [Bacteroides finegoldii]